MGLRCICDVCGHEIRPTQLGAPVTWASISLTFPAGPASRRPGPQPVGPPGPPDYYLICSGKCVEKALEEVKAHLLEAFAATTGHGAD